ncbi:MAG: mechanosensitive ion channel family protein [Deferrisomatales bacterium]
MGDWGEILLEWVRSGRWVGLGKALALLLVAFPLARLASRAVGRAVERYGDAQRAFLAGRAVYYTVVGLAVVSALRELGFQFTVLLGAAGVLTVAVGFASQTSASNLISGLFLMGEEPFVVGDIIKVGDVTGEVLSVDLLSVKLRTFDNLYVRVPNETVIKSSVTNLTRFPIRRVDLQVGVAYKEDLAQVREVLLQVADRNPLCLEEPKPLFIFKGFGESSLDVQFSVWTKRQNFLDLKNGIYEEIKAAFDAQGIEIPFPHRTLYTGAVTDPFPVRLVAGEGTGPADDAPRAEGPDPEAA